MRAIFFALMNQLSLPFSAESPDRPEAAVLLDLWLDHSSEDERDPIGIKGESSYRYFWRTWLNYLDSGKNGLLPNPLPWHDITSVDVVGFLSSGPRGRKANTDPSQITKRRYWRLLERIYAFAYQNRWVRSNPVALLEYADVPPPEDPRGAILTPKMWHAIGELLRRDPGTGPLAIRNQLICQTLFELALMPMELRMLTLSSLVSRQDGPSSWSLFSLQVDGEGVGQRRKLALSPSMAERLKVWRIARGTLSGAQGSDVLFCSRSGAVLTPMQLINIVSALLREAAELCGQPLPPRMGPQVMRNTRLVMWLNGGQAPSQVAVWAGLKDARGLYHLRQHLDPVITLFAKEAQT